MDIRERSWFLIVVLFTVTFIMGMPAHAARYELKDGEQYALCRDYVAALNAYEYEFPMACERHFPLEFEKFAKPKWTPLDPQSKPKSFYRELYYVWYGRPGYEKATEEGWQRVWENRMKPALDAGTLQLDRARVDVGGMGVRVPLLRFAYRPCRENQEWFVQGPYTETYRYFVLDERTGSLNEDFAGLTSIVRGLFYYRGRTYMDHFTGLPLKFLRTQERGNRPDGHLTVVEPYGKVSAPEEYEFDGYRQICVVKVFYELPGSGMED